MMNETEQRQSVVTEARTWLLTPFHHEARVKGAGVDCGMFIAEVYERTGLIPHVDIKHYPKDFMLHRDEEWYLSLVLEYFNEMKGSSGSLAPSPPRPLASSPPSLLPGDIILIKNGRLFSHGLIVIAWPSVIHASAPDKRVVYEDVSLLPLSDKPMRYFRLKGWCDE